ncbi:hypothetical protein FGG78_38025 [Thioclava sp. BHET1]|nr:hypothetical protein FGG78_38025 [Thioclava sp. BHET1]
MTLSSLNNWRDAARLTAASATAWAASNLAASASATGSLPWDSPIKSLVSDLTGPVAFAFVVVGLIGLAIRLRQGGDMDMTGKLLLNFIITGGLLGGAVGLASSWFGLTGAMLQ